MTGPDVTGPHVTGPRMTGTVLADGAGHHHDATDGAGPGVLPDVVVAVGLTAAAVAYVVAVRAARGRGTWPAARTASWVTGLVCVGVPLVGPLAVAARASFTAHMVGHLLLGMAGPLLLVLGAPVSVALRALPVTRARTVARVLRSRLARVLTHPVVAGAANLAGLVLLYGTGLYALAHTSPLVHVLVHAHVLAAGYLLAAALVGPDPAPHRASLHLRVAVLVVFVAGHSSLAKWLSAHPPAGVDAADALVGAQVMYYGGDVVDVALVVLLVAGWYRATRPRPALAVA